MTSDKPNWRTIVVILLVVAVLAVAAAFLTARHVSMELVLILALVAVAASFLLNWYISPSKEKKSKSGSQGPSSEA